MGILNDEIASFTATKARQRADAMQLAALQLICGLDLRSVLNADAAARYEALARIRRRLNRERLKGLSRHWSYDLNRHIALKQACDAIRATLGPQLVDATEKPTRVARRRRAG